MCRIVGFIDQENSADAQKSILRQMRDALAYGGPDASGEFFDESAGLALGHRRLSILDLNERSDQPMSSATHTICFNGECYNFKAIRDSSEFKHELKTDSDTEVVLWGFKSEGLSFVHKMRGMFSLAIWDEREKTTSIGT